MEFLKEFRNPMRARHLLDKIRQTVTKPTVLMEVCGGQTHSLLRYGIDSLLPPHVELVHGPGCPVCVTPMDVLDQAHRLAYLPGVTVFTYGDLLRVPGTQEDFLSVQAKGGKVKMAVSPLQALEWAEQNPDQIVVFLAVGFETTAPAHAAVLARAIEKDILNFALLVSHVGVPPAIEAILKDPDNRIQGFLAAGHVCTVMGLESYYPLVQRHRVPIVVTGFEPVDLLQGILMAVELLEKNEFQVVNQYSRCVNSEGNPTARALVEQVFEVQDQAWRGLGVLPKSGLKIRAEYAHWDAQLRFKSELEILESATGIKLGSVQKAQCHAGEVLTGKLKPPACPHFGKECRPDSPLGAPMVSTEGACAAYFSYHERSAL